MLQLSRTRPRSGLFAQTAFAMLAFSALAACAPQASTSATAAAPANFTGIWAGQSTTIDDGVAAGYPVTLRNTSWALLSAGPPEQQKAEDLATVRAAVEKVINDKGDVFAWARARAFKPPLTEAGMAAQKAMMEARAKAPREAYARCLPQNSVGFGGGGASQIFQTEKRVVVVPENGGASRSIFIDGEAGRENSVPTYVGYSAAKWEGKSLVVTTTNFQGETANGGWPMSADAKVEETFSLSPDGNLLTVKIVYSDPQYLKEPIARMVYLDKKPEDTLLLASNCLEDLAGAAEFAKVAGSNYDKGVLP